MELEHRSFLENGYAHQKVKDFPPLPEDGSRYQFHEQGYAWLSKDGSVTVETKLAEPGERQGFEKFLPQATELGLGFYERAHAQGAGTGIESPHGITLTPELVNQELQNRGVEALIRELQEHKRDDVDLYLRTEVKTDNTGMFLQQINYELEAAKKSDDAFVDKRERLTLFTTSIEVAGPKEKPQVKFDIEGGELFAQRDLSSILRDPTRER
jgi:hypothetical protein